MRVLGMDEAGRGCVLGPLVVGGFLLPADDEARLSAVGATDSKKLSARRRVSIREALRPLGEAAVHHISPQQIDAGNINQLEFDAFLALILQFRPDRVMIDAPCHPSGIPAFLRRLQGAVEAGGGGRPLLQAEPKADLNHPVVGAASIFAKVARDAEIEALGPVGSGYPSDPVTRAWLLGFITREQPFPPSVRTRWATLDNLRQQALFR